MEKRSYYIKDLPRLPKSALYNEDYYMGRTANYDGAKGILGRWGRDSLGKRFDRLRYYRSLVEKIWARSPSSVLDVGCGLGFLVRELIKAGIKAQGVEISSWAVWHRVCPQVQLGDAANLPFGDKEFDLVFSHDVLEHIPVGELPQVLKELQRVGRRNYHIISCGSLPDDRDITHVTMMPISWWKRLVEKLDGFEVEKKD